MPSISASESHDVEAGTEDKAYLERHSKPFRFKSQPSKTRSQRREACSSPHDRRHTRRHHHHRTRPSRKTPSRRSSDDNDTGFKACAASELSAEAAFKESLFDALGDDEGATFWEGVYGQPIHNYSDMKANGEKDSLERMTDDEYATFVRRKMWEKSREGIEAAREQQRAQERMEREAQSRGSSKRTNASTDRERSRFDSDVDAALERGQERTRKRRRFESWQTYQQNWSQLSSLVEKIKNDSSERSQCDISLRNKIAWPVDSGQREDINETNIKIFMESAVVHGADRSESEQAYLKALKMERIRWHPDKIQQRFSALEIDEHTKRGVTIVFQILDKLWNQSKKSN